MQKNMKKYSSEIIIKDYNEAINYLNENRFLESRLYEAFRKKRFKIKIELVKVQNLMLSALEGILTKEEKIAFVEIVNHMLLAYDKMEYEAIEEIDTEFFITLNNACLNVRKDIDKVDTKKIVEICKRLKEIENLNVLIKKHMFEFGRLIFNNAENKVKANNLNYNLEEYITSTYSKIAVNYIWLSPLIDKMN